MTDSASLLRAARTLRQLATAVPEAWGIGASGTGAVGDRPTEP
jgi:hypothetical protein